MKRAPLYKKALAFLILGGGFIFYFLFIHGRIDLAPLPVIGPEGHMIPEFSFRNQDNEIISSADYKNKVYVTDFFFTSCKGICPIMTNHMKKVQDAYREEDDVMFLSHTVDPERDTAATLKQYADQMGADLSKWNFVTGSKDDLYELGEKGYFLTVMKGDTAKGQEDFLHDRSFLLIDKERRIRGVYDGTDSVEVDRLITEVGMLLNEYNNKRQ